MLHYVIVTECLNIIFVLFHDVFKIIGVFPIELPWQIFLRCPKKFKVSFSGNRTLSLQWQSRKITIRPTRIPYFNYNTSSLDVNSPVATRHTLAVPLELRPASSKMISH